MRKLYYFLTIAVMLTAIVGCQKNDEFLNVQNTTDQTFYAIFENNAYTRTALDENNNVIWSEGDQISVFSATTANNPFILNEGANTNYGTFRPNSYTGGTESSGSISNLSANVAYYPYNSNVTVSENNGSYTLKVTFPAKQTYSTSGTFGNGTSPMVAVTSSTLDANLKFKNVGAIFRLQLKGSASITKIIFSAEENLAGNCNITASNTSNPSVSVVEGSKTIILDCGEGVQLSDTPTNFIVSMLPVENLTEGITITIYDNAGKKMICTWNAHSTIERSKAYSTEETVYNGDQEANTEVSVQTALDNATTGTTIQLEPGIDYGVLEIRAVNGNPNTTSNDNYSIYHYDLLRKVENLTIKGAPGATVDAIKVVSGYMGQIIDGKTTCYFADIKNLVIDGVEFTDNYTNPSHKYAAPIFISLTHTNLDGLTVKNCKLEGDNENMNFVYFYSKAQTDFTTAAKNVTIEGNTVEGIARLCELRGTENVTITNNTIKNTYLHAILLAKDGINYSGDITITGNKADGIRERFVRMSGAGNANVVIKNNTISNYHGKDPDYIKVTDSNGNLTIENNTYSVGSAEDLNNALNSLVAGNMVVLEKDIDLTDKEWSVSMPWQGSSTDVIFDGKGHKITGLNTTGLQGGLLGKYNSNGNITIKNLMLVDVTIKGTDIDGESAGGALIGWIENHGAGTITIENVNVEGIKAQGFKYIGGLIGYNNGNVAMNLIDCSVTGKADSFLNSTYNESGNYKGHIGGLLGLWMKGSITNCTVEDLTIKHGTDDMTGSSNRAGALVGTKYAGVEVVSATVKNVTVDGTPATANSLFGPSASSVTDNDKNNVTIN